MLIFLFCSDGDAKNNRAQRLLSTSSQRRGPVCQEDHVDEAENESRANEQVCERPIRALCVGFVPAAAVRRQPQYFFPTSLCLLTFSLECRQCVSMQITGFGLRRQREQLGLSQAKLAELSGIPQHLLSAFELEKSGLPSPVVDSLLTTLLDESRVSIAVKRRKRYRAHKYCTVKPLPDRVGRAAPSTGNAEYRRALQDLATLHSNPKSDELAAISLFSGCGGFSLGFSAAGFQIKAFVEIDPGLRTIYRRNFPTTAEIGGDITKISDEALHVAITRLGQADVIFGGPPCQGFSPLWQKAGQRSSKRAVSALSALHRSSEARLRGA